MQIRSRLTLQFILTVAAIMLLTLGFIYIQYRQTMEDEFYSGLRFKAMMTANMVLRHEEEFDARDTIQSDTNRQESVLPIKQMVAIFDMERKQIFSMNAPEEKLRESTYQLTASQGECCIHYCGLPALALRTLSPSGRPYVVVAASEFRTDHLQNLQNILIAGFFISIGLVAFVGYIFSGRAMAPVSRIVNEVDAILPSDLSARLQSPENNDEIARLINTFNRMLDRIQVAFQMQKRFVSNVSHELKNPISVIVSQLEVALNRERSPQDYQHTLRSVLDDSYAMADITEKLLQISRVHSEDSHIEFVALRLDELVLQVQSGLLRSKPDYHILFDMEGNIEQEEQLIIAGNEALLRLALSNLIDNGCKFSPDHRVSLKLLAKNGKKPVLELIDNGPGIPAEDLPYIFQPFYRGIQQAKVAGSGIGLSLVDSILRLHHIQFQVISESGKGTKITLRFPEQLNGKAASN
ncbi:MAG: sensor histidine kinase [Saprospiraceae bacterium]